MVQIVTPSAYRDVQRDPVGAVRKYTRPWFRPRVTSVISGKGDRRAAVVCADVEGTVIAHREPVRPHILRLTEGRPQLRAAALRAAGMSGDEVAGVGDWFKDNIIDPVGDAAQDAGNWIKDKAESFAKDTGLDKVVRKAVEIGKKVYNVAKDVASSPYFQMAMTVMPIPGTAAIAAGIRTVQTIEALAKKAAKGDFSAQAAMELAKAGLQLTKAVSPEAKKAAENAVRKAKKMAKDAGINPEAIKRSLNIAKTQAKKVVDGKFSLEKLVKDPNAIAKIAKKAKQAATGAEKQALAALADAVNEKKKQLRAQGRLPRQQPQKRRRQGMPQDRFNRKQAWMRQPDGTIVPKAKKVRRWGWNTRGKNYKKFPSPALQNYINRRLRKQYRFKLGKANKRAQALGDYAKRQAQLRRKNEKRAERVAKYAKALKKKLLEIEKQRGGRGGGIEPSPALQRAAAARGKRLYMVQAPSKKVYPVAL